MHLYDTIEQTDDYVELLCPDCGRRVVVDSNGNRITKDEGDPKADHMWVSSEAITSSGNMWMNCTLELESEETRRMKELDELIGKVFDD